MIVFQCQIEVWDLVSQFTRLPMGVSIVILPLLWSAVEQHPFEVTETGWGEFDIHVRIHFQDAAEKQLQILLPLKLFPTDDAIVTKSAEAEGVVSVKHETCEEIVRE